MSILEMTPINPIVYERREKYFFADFGKDRWGNLRITFPQIPQNRVQIRLGEKLDASGNIDRNPPGSVSYRELFLTPRNSQKTYQLKIPTLPAHKKENVVKSHSDIGEITPFRYAEIEFSSEVITPPRVQQLFVHAPFNDNAADFKCSDSMLNAVWDLCKHTMKAATAFGVYIDGERERIAYEADAYISQLSHLACDFDATVARATMLQLLEYPTWPTEWSFHLIMTAAADYQATGKSTFISSIYEQLKPKLLMEKARIGGLLRVGAIVDWPRGERDNFNNNKPFPNDSRPQLGPEINAAANAFYFHALNCMAFLANALGKKKESAEFRQLATQVFQSFNKYFFDAEKVLYIDGISAEGTHCEHVSLHANMFALALGLVPQERQNQVANYVASRGMACSVYGAQYLLEALFRAGNDIAALQLLTSRKERSWWHMIEAGSTMTWEAWDAKYKPNLTWNHAWGAAPANIVTRFILGVRPLESGYEKILIAPQLGTLKWAKGTVPTPHGSVKIEVRRGDYLDIQYSAPQNVEVIIDKQASARKSTFIAPA